MDNNITYQDKQALNINPDIADVNKVNAGDMNQIKNAINETILTSLFGVSTNTWISQAGYGIGAIVIYNYKIYKNITGTNSSTAPAQDTTNWQETNILESINNTTNINDEMYIKIPIGGGCDYYGSTAPAHFMFANGQAISRTTYSKLFEIIGTTYGSGDGSTTFNLPNKTGRIGVGLDTTQTEFDTLGETGGNKNLQAHTHYISANDGGTTILSSSNQLGFYATSGDSDLPYSLRGTSVSATIGKTSSTGGGNAQNLQPYIVQNYIIRVE